MVSIVMKKILKPSLQPRQPEGGADVSLTTPHGMIEFPSLFAALAVTI
jgi:hypothetical protein